MLSSGVPALPTRTLPETPKVPTTQALGSPSELQPLINMEKGDS